MLLTAYLSVEKPCASQETKTDMEGHPCRLILYSCCWVLVSMGIIERKLTVSYH